MDTEKNGFRKTGSNGEKGTSRAKSAKGAKGGNLHDMERMPPGGLVMAWGRKEMLTGQREERKAGWDGVDDVASSQKVLEGMKSSS